MHHQLAPAAIVASGLSFAGLGETGLLETLPKGALLAIIAAMFGLILFFAKRDYARINGDVDGSKKALADLRRLVELNHNFVMLQLTECAKTREISVSLNRVHEKLNAATGRIINLESKAGMHDRGSLVESSSFVEVAVEVGKGDEESGE